MQELPFNIKRSIRKYEPIETEGLTLYPVRVSEFEEFLTAKPALEVLQQSLPVALMGIPLLSAFFKVDCGASELPPTGMFSLALLGLTLSLRLGEGAELKQRLELWRWTCDKEDGTKLKDLRCMLHGEEQIVITPVQYQRLRPIIAAQNGVKLESEDANPELVQAEKDLAEGNLRLDAGIEHLISFVSALSGTDETEIEEWPILKLQNHAEALRRALDYHACFISEGQGVKWKGGNPVPHPWFPRERSESAALMPLGEFAGGAGERAVAQQSANAQTETDLSTGGMDL